MGVVAFGIIIIVVGAAGIAVAFALLALPTAPLLGGSFSSHSLLLMSMFGTLNILCTVWILS